MLRGGWVRNRHWWNFNISMEFTIGVLVIGAKVKKISEKFKVFEDNWLVGRGCDQLGSVRLG